MGRRGWTSKALVGLALLLRGLGAPFRLAARGGRWLRGAYLTLRHADEWDAFPAIQVKGPVRLRIVKKKGARLVLRGRLIVHPWFEGRNPVVLNLGQGSTTVIGGDFDLGDDVRIRVRPGARLEIGGKGPRGFSGITSRCTILCWKEVRLGKDVVLSWSTYVADSDWHPIGGSIAAEPTSIGDHVLVSPGSSVLKGAHVGADSIVAVQSVVVRGTYEPRSLLAGNPAKPIPAKRPVWDWAY